MANTKISELPLFTGNTSGSYLVMNNSGQTTTYKIQKENYVFPYNGAAVISGSLAVSGSITTNANSTFNGVNVGRAAGNTATSNTRVGSNSLIYTGVGAVGTSNTAIGSNSLRDVSVGFGNTAVGTSALTNNISGSLNTAVGAGGSLANLRIGNENTAIGYGNLVAMQTGSSQLAIGTSNLSNYLGDGFNNMAVGPRFVLSQLRSGAENIAIGSYAMQNVITGSNNTVIGGGALANITGSNNIALGYYAGTSLTGTVDKTLIIDSLYRTNYPNQGLIYGTMDSTVANQTLKVNAKTSITNDLNVTGSVKLTEALNLKPLYIGTGSVYANNLQNVPGQSGDIRMVYDDTPTYSMAYFTISGSNSWNTF